jgi:hypothetical protein
MNILLPDISIAEKMLRAAVEYTFLLVAFRLCGARQLGQLSAFDLAVRLLISSVLPCSSAMAGSSGPTCGGSGHVSVVTRRPAGE